MKTNISQMLQCIGFYNIKTINWSPVFFNRFFLLTSCSPLPLCRGHHLKNANEGCLQSFTLNAQKLYSMNSDFSKVFQKCCKCVPLKEIHMWPLWSEGSLQQPCLLLFLTPLCQLFHPFFSHFIPVFDSLFTDFKWHFCPTNTLFSFYLDWYICLPSI